MSQRDKRQDEMKAIDRLDRIIHEPARLKIMTHLYVVESGDFLCGGCVQARFHMTKLEEVDYVEVIKEFVDRKPVTMLRLTKKGRNAFLEYRKNMALAIEATK